MRAIIGLSILFGTMTASAVKARMPAEGFGAAARGGEGGRVIRVTNLADDGEGSLREALAQRGPRMIEFAVEGEIELDSRLRIHESSVTLDGSTAPGKGITLLRHGLDVVNAEDVILRGLRIHVSEGGATGDGVLLWGKDGGVTRRVLVDQCSIHGATDEGVNTWGRVEDVTFQWCLIADSAPARTAKAGYPERSATVSRSPLPLRPLRGPESQARGRSLPGGEQRLRRLDEQQRHQAAPGSPRQPDRHRLSSGSGIAGGQGLHLPRGSSG